MQNNTTTKPMESNMEETLEEAAESRYGTDMDSIRGSNVYDLNTDLKKGFIDGAKWQQEELEKELNRFFLYLRNSGEHFIGVPNEQFVKKYLKSR